MLYDERKRGWRDMGKTPTPKRRDESTYKEGQVSTGEGYSGEGRSVNMRLKYMLLLFLFDVALISMLIVRTIKIIQ